MKTNDLLTYRDRLKKRIKKLKIPIKHLRFGEYSYEDKDALTFNEAIKTVLKVIDEEKI